MQILEGSCFGDWIREINWFLDSSYWAFIIVNKRPVTRNQQLELFHISIQVIVNHCSHYT
jgi:hypothetical protein